MIESKDKVREQLSYLIVHYGNGRQRDSELEETVDEILAIPEIAIVDREAKLPENYGLDSTPGLCLSSTALFDIRRVLKNLLTNWVKEEKCLKQKTN